MRDFRTVFAAVALTAGLTIPCLATQVSAQRAGGPPAAAPQTPAPPPPQAPAGRAQGGGRGDADFWPGLKHLLAVADVQSGYHHDSISHALATVEQIGRKSGTYMTMIRTDSQLITNDPIVGRDR